MRTSLLLGLGLLIAFRANADEISREPAMESIGPTVIGESIDDQAEDLSKGPIDLQFSYIADFGRNLMGGARVDNAFMGLAALRANFDLNKALGWNGGSVFLHLQSVQGTGLSPLTSDMQIQSNIEANAYGGKIYEAWFKQELFNGKASVLAGLYDFNSEFYLTQSSVVFLNSSFGVGGEILRWMRPHACFRRFRPRLRPFV